MTLVLELPPELEACLREDAAQRGETAEASALRLLEAALPLSTDKAILAMFASARAGTTPADWERAPRDLASNLDRGLYGSRDGDA